MRLLFFAGSTRERSHNRKLASLAHHIAEANGIEAVLVDLKDYPMPIYNGDLEAKNGPPERARAFHFSQPSKSHLAFQLLGLINSGRLKLPARTSAPPRIYDECWQQLCLARYRLPAPDLMDFYVDPADGHDDYLMSLALLTEALAALKPPALTSALVRPRRLYENEGRF